MASPPEGDCACCGPPARPCEGWSNKAQLRPISGCFVRELALSLVRGVVEDGPVQPGLGLDVPAGFIRSAIGRFRHGLHPQILERDPAVVLGKVGGELVGEVLAAACLPRPELGDVADRVAQPVGVAATVVLLSPGHLAGLAALQPQQASSLPRGECRRQQARFPLVGNEGRAGHPEVHATPRQPVRRAGSMPVATPKAICQPRAPIEMVALRPTPPSGRDSRNCTHPSFGRRTAAHFREYLRT
jgi:hypothetical protein